MIRSLRVRGGRTVDCWVLRRFLFLSLVTWGVRVFNEDGSIFETYRKTAWRPCWRII